MLFYNQLNCLYYLVELLLLQLQIYIFAAYSQSVYGGRLISILSQVLTMAFHNTEWLDGVFVEF